MKTVAIVGRPNVGKSSLFNRLTQQQHAVIHEMPGVTRDRIYAHVTWHRYQFQLIDTGGLTTKEKLPFYEEVAKQTDQAVNETDVILWMVDIKEPLTAEDELISKKLLKTGKPIILVVNKYDHYVNNYPWYEYQRFGCGLPLPISTLHGIGIGDLLDHIVTLIPEPILIDQLSPSDINIVILGRQNVGKSTLTNLLTDEQQRVIVSEVPGTTRDVIKVSITKHHQPYQIFDTAGIKAHKSKYHATDKAAIQNIERTLQNTDLVLLVLDGEQGIVHQDLIVGGYAFQYQKPVIVIINKIDLLSVPAQQQILKQLKAKFQYLSYSKTVLISAKHHLNIGQLWSTITLVHQTQLKIIKTSALNQLLVHLQLFHKPPIKHGHTLKIYYGTQANGKTPIFLLFVNNPAYVVVAYERFLINEIRHAFGFEGVPIKLVFKPK